MDSGRTTGIPAVQSSGQRLLRVKAASPSTLAIIALPQFIFPAPNPPPDRSRVSLSVAIEDPDLSATMLSFRSVLRPSTGALRQLLPSMIRQPFSHVARPFTQLTRLSLGNGLRSLRAGKAQTENVSVASVGSTVRQIEQVRGMKTRSSVKRLCDGCKVWIG